MKNNTVTFNFVYYFTKLNRTTLFKVTMSIFFILSLLSIVIPQLPFLPVYSLYVILYNVILTIFYAVTLVHYDSDVLFDLYGKELGSKLKDAVRKMGEE